MAYRVDLKQSLGRVQPNKKRLFGFQNVFFYSYFFRIFAKKDSQIAFLGV